jgi:4-hydroxy-tetrahydrodipicolinate synthase
VVAPYYNRPSQEGILAHFSYLAEKIDLPIVLYNVPARTVTDIKPETVIELTRRFPGKIIGIKDASGDLSRVTDHRMGLGGDFCQLSGDDELALPFNAAGGVGCISVTANVAPGLCAQFQAACAAGDLTEARRLNDLLYPLHYAMFEDASPGPVKYALSKVVTGFRDELRLPMVGPNAAARAAVDAALTNAGLG